MRHAEEELPPSSLRGRLCEVLLPALLTEMIDALLRRLGEKAVLDDAIFGVAAGIEPLRPRLGEWAKFLVDRETQYDRSVTIVGGDRDVTEGTFELRQEGHHRTLPVAVLMQRLREREVVVRIFLATSAFALPSKGPAVPLEPAATAVPTFAADMLEALAKRDGKAVAATFEEESSVRDALGAEHGRDAVARILSLPMTVQGVADNGQACALEVALGDTKRLGLLVLQRGDSGLVRSLRIYSE
jgi:hypothetical protein